MADTNCFIFLLDENPILLPFLDKGWSYSFITEIELLSYPPLTAEQSLIIKNMLSSCYKVPMFQEVSELTIEIRKTTGLKIPDAIIAATALQLRLPLLTADQAFSRVKNLDTIIIEL